MNKAKSNKSDKEKAKRIVKQIERTLSDFEESFYTSERILPDLMLDKPCKINLYVTNTTVELRVGPRNYTWDRDTGKLTGAGTYLGSCLSRSN